VEAGFTCGTEGDMLVKRKMIQKARTSVVMCSKEKFSCLMPYTFANLSEVDYLVTDGMLPEGFRSAADEVELKVL
jgi:DeoR family transcriptional regulator of aga operon